jgi:hypothetical protein
MCAQYLFDDEVKEGAHGAFTPAMMQLSQVTWIETFLEGVTDKITGDPTFKTSSPGLGARSLVSCAQLLTVSTPGLSRGGFQVVLKT